MSERMTSDGAGLGATWLRAAGALVAFLALALAGLAVYGVDWLGPVLVVAAAGAGVAYAGIEYAQTRALGSITGGLTTRTIALMPIAIAINIALGAAVQQYLKLPIYLDSIGTILVGILAGPIAGLLTGALANLIWGYLLPAPVGSATIGPFFVTAAVIGLLAGLWGRAGFFRSRAGESGRTYAGAAVAAVLIAALAFYTYTRAYGSPEQYEGALFFDPATFDQSRIFFTFLMFVFVGLIGWALFLKRDVGAVYAIGAGLVTGIAAAIVSAPIAAYVFGGVTGSGTDLLVAGFRQAGSDLFTATLQQGLLSDPLDKMVTAFVVFLVVTSLPRRFVARFPNGERLLPPEA
jgi:energy-coupling factor transport system substrate-specific component